MKSTMFEVGGVSYALRLTMAAMCRYQDRSGETIGVAIDGIQKDSTDMIRARRLFWVSLDKAVTEEEAGELMEALGLPEAFRLVGEVLANCVETLAGGEQGGNGKKPREKAAA